MTGRLPDEVSRSVMRFRTKVPFLGVLALHTPWRADSTVETAATNGEEVVFNPAFLDSLSPEHCDAVVAHEVVHVAMRHVGRCGDRDPTRWNIAADVVTNGMVERLGLKLPPGAIRDRDLEHLRVEDMYQRLVEPSAVDLRKLGARMGNKLRDLMPGPDDATEDQRKMQDAAWRDVVRKAMVIHRMQTRGRGDDALSEIREIAELLDPQLDWRTLLWRFVVQTPTDYAGWDRRFVHAGQYVDCLEGERLAVSICIDTSGSVDRQMLTDFMAELQGIVGAYPHIRVRVFFADTQLYGPWWLDRTGALPMPVGGGGTDFQPFFEVLAAGEHKGEPIEADLAIYLTDGFGLLPDDEPQVPMMWLVPAGQRDEFPWGEVARLEVQ